MGETKSKYKLYLKLAFSDSPLSQVQKRRPVQHTYTLIKTQNNILSSRWAACRKHDYLVFLHFCTIIIARELDRTFFFAFFSRQFALQLPQATVDDKSE